jgi:hypothetical protein
MASEVAPLTRQLLNGDAVVGVDADFAHDLHSQDFHF